MVDVSERSSKGVPAEWALIIIVPIFKGKGDILNCNC